MGCLPGFGPVARQLSHGVDFSGCRLFGLCCGFSGLNCLGFPFYGLPDLPADLLSCVSSGGPLTGGGTVARDTVFCWGIGRVPATRKTPISSLFSLFYRAFSGKAGLRGIHRPGHLTVLFVPFPNSFCRCPLLHECPIFLKMFPGRGGIRRLLAVIRLSGFDPWSWGRHIGWALCPE